MLITSENLRKANVNASSIARFEEVYPNGIELPPKSRENDNSFAKDPKNVVILCLDVLLSKNGQDFYKTQCYTIDEGYSHRCNRIMRSCHTAEEADEKFQAAYNLKNREKILLLFRAVDKFDWEESLVARIRVRQEAHDWLAEDYRRVHEHSKRVAASIPPDPYVYYWDRVPPYPNSHWWPQRPDGHRYYWEH